MERSLLKFTEKDLLEKLKEHGYHPTMRLDLLGEKGESVLRELEADRRSVFRSLFKKDWKERLMRANEMSADDHIELAVDYLLIHFEYKKD